MAFVENFKSGLNLVGNTITEVASVLNEKNRLRAQCARIKQIIKHDAKARDNAYIELGRYYYQNLKDEGSSELKAYCDTITRMNTRIEKASLKYIQLQDAQNDIQIQSENAEKLKAAMSEKADQIKSMTRDKAKEISEKFSSASDKESAESEQEKSDAALDTSDIENAVKALNEEMLIEETDIEIYDDSIRIDTEIIKAKVDAPEAALDVKTKADRDITPEEESPETFDFND